MLHHAGGRVRHGLREGHAAGVLLPGLKAVIRLAGGVDQRLARPGGAADGELLQRPAIAAHGVALEVGQHQHGIIIHNILAHAVLFQNLAVWDRPNHIRPLGVHQIHIKILGPAVLLQKLEVGLGIVPHPGAGIAIGSVALHDGAADLLHHGLPEFRVQEVLVALFTGVDLHRHLAGQRNAQGVIQLHNILRGNFWGKINFCFHIKSSLRCFC